MAKLSFNRLVQRDLSNILDYYERETGARKLGERFFKEFRRLIERITDNPSRFGLHREGTRRAYFIKFPHSIVFRVTEESEVRILFIRHHERHPDYGMRRK